MQKPDCLVFTVIYALCMDDGHVCVCEIVQIHIDSYDVCRNKCIDDHRLLRNFVFFTTD